MNTLEYSIVYAMIRPEIRERISVGIIFYQSGKFEVKYSNAKLRVVKHLIPSMDYGFLRRSVVSLAENDVLDSVSQIEHLNRYSNNLLTVSEIRTVKIESSNISKKRLYKMYVYNKLS